MVLKHSKIKFKIIQILIKKVLDKIKIIVYNHLVKRLFNNYDYKRLS